MELNLKQDRLSGYRTLLETSVLHEETMEAIVPDACPDILHITDTCGQILLKGREAQEGRAEISGTVQCAVLYLPEEGSGLRRMEVSVPFTCAVPAEKVTSSCRVVAAPRVSAAETRALNPRKILLRLGLCIDVQIFAPVEEVVCTAAESDGEIEQLVEEHSAYLTACVQEKPFTFEDELEIPGGRPDAAEILRSGVRLQCAESRIIGNKLIFKGEAALKLLYRTAEGEAANTEYTLPFSQIMEVTEAGEEADCTVEVQPTDFSCTLLGDGRAVSVSMELLAQAVVRERRNVEILSDLYATHQMIKPSMQSYTLSQLTERGSRRQTVREMLETEGSVKSVSDVYVCLGETGQSREGERLQVTAEAEITVIYAGEDGRISTVVKPVKIPCALELPEGCACFCTCRNTGEAFAAPTAGGVEVRLDVDFSYLALTTVRMSGVIGAEVTEEEDGGEGEMPSIVLRSVGEERLWDLAKAYRTTRAEILRANELESGEGLSGRLLLIPRKR